jgi:DNA primase
VPGRIRDDSIAQVRDGVDIVALIGEYVALRPAGGSRMKGLCPFHQEKTASFTVNPDKAVYHCLAGETRVLTAEGVREIRDLAGETHRVLARDATWVDAPFRSFGVQRLMKLVLSRNGQTKEIFATPEHRWFVRAGKDRRSDREVVTQALKPEHRLVWKYPPNVIKQVTPSPFGIAHGIVYGDGSRLNGGSIGQLTPGKDAQLLKWFPNSVVAQREDRLQIFHLPKFFKELPPLDESVSYLYGWLAGYFAADGHVSKDGTVMLNCAVRSTLEYVRAVCTRLGIGTYGITEQVREGFPGREPSSLFRVHFVNNDLTESFFLIDEHRLRFASTSKLYERRGWVVRSVEETDRVEEVFCATVENGHAFVLEDNILTGNCFGCGESGDAIDFVQKQETLSFIEAIERLAARSGVELQYEGRSAGERGSIGRKSRLVAAHAEAVRFYSRMLLEDPDGAPARAYLSARGYNREVAERFGLGWAPAGSWESLTGHLRRAGFSPDELTAAGLARTGSRGLRDFFHARVLFPIFDTAGEPVAFGGRILTDTPNAPKYLNTAETAIWDKGRALYALNWAKQPIVRAGFALVVEGYTDVLSLHANGVEQAVATCGTALRADHFRLLSRFTGKVVLAFDADNAGSKAGERGVPELISDPNVAVSAYVLIIPEGLDPADFVAKHGGQAFAELIATATPLTRWWLDANLARHDLRSLAGRSRASHELLPILRSVPDAQQRMEYAGYALKRLQFVGPLQNGLDSEYQALIRGQAAPGAGRERASGKAVIPRRTREARTETEALKFALQHPDLATEAAAAWDEDWFTTPGTRAAFTALHKAGGVGSALAEVLEAAANETERRFLRSLAVEPFAGEEERGYAEGVFHRLEELRLTRDIDALKATLQRMNPVEQPDNYNSIFGDLIALEARRRVLREAAARG